MKPKILCVDDEVEITKALARLFSKDFVVETAGSVSEAKAKITPDLAVILTDLHLPDGNGFEILQEAQAKAPDTVRALLTAHVAGDDLVDVINRKLVHRLILKPWENEYVRLQMLEALSTHETFNEKRELEKLAITDPVTLLRNHRFFQDQLKIEVTRALRHGRNLSLIMLDIDRFKTFNDTYGHPAGDKLLQEAGQRLGEAVRNLDTVSRYGGEEFAILLPDTAADRALLVAERVRQRFSDNPFLVNGNSTLVTISLGVASCPEHASTPESLVEAADEALYRAKGQGRNQSVVASLVKP